MTTTIRTAALTAPPARLLPGRGHTTCDRCGARIVWARTVAGPNGPGGKAMPLDAPEDQAGNVAASPARAGRLLARALTADEQADRPIEYLAMPHFATCRAVTGQGR